MAEKPEERFAYGLVLEALSRGLYPDKRHIIREFVQNSFDSICELRRSQPKIPPSPIEVKIESPSIFIADRGIGMTEAQISQYRYLGFSQKQPAKHAGFRGIGKYSGTAVAEKIIVDSSPFGVPHKYRVVLHTDRMLAAVGLGKNIPLENILREHTEFFTSSENPQAHYTFVELHGISKDAAVLMNESDMAVYLARTAPVLFDPRFQFAKSIHRKLYENISEFMASELLLNGQKIYKPFFKDCLEPEFETILFDDEKPDLLAFCWYCQNSEKGQFEPKDDAGLVFRVKNISVGDGQLSRRMLWKTTPERAFYFHGEIHVLDPGVIASSDRTDFEDNDARGRLGERCQRISTNLRRKAGEESALRRFDEALVRGNEIVDERESQIESGNVPIELKEQVVFEIQKIQEDVKKRLKGPKQARIVRRARRLMGKTRTFLQVLRTERKAFIDLQIELKFEPKLRSLYETVLEVLREEFRGQPERLERIIRRIHEALKTKLSA